MIKETLDLLRSNDWLIEDLDINIAKGLYEMPSNFKELKTNIKRKKLVRNGRQSSVIKIRDSRNKRS